MGGDELCDLAEANLSVTVQKVGSHKIFVALCKNPSGATPAVHTMRRPERL